MLEYKDLVHHFMTASVEQLVERVAETHLRYPLGEVPTLAEPQDVGETQILTPTTGEGPQCADPSESTRIVDTVEGGGPNGLSEFSNNTSTMDIDDRHFNDPDSNDEVENHLSKVSTMLVRLLLNPVLILQKGEMVIEGFYFFHIPVLKIRGGKVMDKRRTPHPRLSVPSVAPNLASTVHQVVEALGDVSSFFPASNTVHVLAIGDDSSSLFLVIEVRDDSSSPPSAVEVRDDSPSLSLKTSTSPPIDIQHQDKENEVTKDEGEKVAPKRDLEGEDTSTDSGGVKKSRMAPP
ncbi:hypothetical protein Adt_41297 [Abeliophyllum distichum]|uniref:Uncharacterized protein n=1 Tax=Abeliophyllum distichum TaxID=126358 RepID=A0ABD1PSC1_9LAMI